jgi:antirestriction protein ArdC
MRPAQKRDYAQEISNIILSRIESGVLPWRRPWRTFGAGGRPLRHNGTPYTGINTLFLWALADAHGYRSRYWMTYRQAEELGAQVRRGERSSISVYYNSFNKTETNSLTGQDTSKTVRFLRAYAVFCADQIDGLPPHYYGEQDDHLPPPPSDHQAAIDAFFKPIPVEVRHGGDRAYYSPSADFVQMPNLAAFRSADHYASCLGHELGHATGATHRLNRQFGKRFGDKAYSFEELCADLCASLVCSELGLPNELLDGHAAYIQHWAAVMRADKTAIIHAAAKAEQAYRWLASFSQGAAEFIEEEAADAQVPIAA